MLPGLVVTEDEDYYTKPFTESQVVSVTTTDSSWPVAVGFSLVNSSVLTIGYIKKKTISLIFCIYKTSLSILFY